MNVVHAVGWYFPESSGGTEVYVDALARNLLVHGVESSVAAATDGPSSSEYAWNGVNVRRYPVAAARAGEMSLGGRHGRFDEFANWLRRQDVAIYHQHSWTRGCGLQHLRVAKALGLKTVLTVHVPGALCLRGTMMLNGTAACDGRLDVTRCTQCWGEARGIPESVVNWQARHPVWSRRIAETFLPSRAKTAFLTPALVAGRQADVIEMGRVADRIVAVCRWLFDALERNGVPREKLSYCAQGIDLPVVPRSVPREPRGARPLRVGFVGRWDPVKGAHVLVEAFRRLPPDTPAELSIHALPQDGAYERRVRASATGDPRIHIGAPVAHDQIFDLMSGFDVLAVPSLWLETGPLVALEALAAGTPVLGSDLGGIAELVSSASGTLVPSGDVEAWSRAIADAASSTNDYQVPRLPRSSRQVAAEMAALYREVATAEPMPAAAHLSASRHAVR